MDRKEILEYCLGLALAEEKRLAHKRALVTESLIASEAERHKATKQYERVCGVIKGLEAMISQGVLF